MPAHGGVLEYEYASLYDYSTQSKTTKHKINVGQIIRMFAGAGRSVTHTAGEGKLRSSKQ